MISDDAFDRLCLDYAKGKITLDAFLKKAGVNNLAGVNNPGKVLVFRPLGPQSPRSA